MTFCLFSHFSDLNSTVSLFHPKKWPVNEDQKVVLLFVSLLSVLTTTTVIGSPYSPRLYVSPRRTAAAAATSPPPLNFRTRPNYGQTNPPQSNTTSVFNNNPRLQAVYVQRDHLADIQNALRYLGLPPLLVLEDAPNESASSRLSSSRLSSSQLSSSQLSSQGDTDFEGHNYQSSEYLELTESFSALSTSADTVPVTPFTARTGPVFISGPGSSPPVSPKCKVEKYYAIIVGKCAGVYWNEWLVSLPLIYCVANLNMFRDNVLPLVSNVSGARYRGFATLETAKDYYLNAKRMGKVRIVRDPGDDQVFGPESEAIQ